MGRMPKETAMRLAQHCRSCPHCRAELRQVQRFVRALRDALRCYRHSCRPRSFHPWPKN